jgi:hypothetical protein
VAARRPSHRPTGVAAKYDRSVFINCPFDRRYQPLFHAVVFTVFECDYVPRCALEAYDSGLVRIDNIFHIVGECRLGIHDISRTELDRGSRLPRFNMPLELGMFLGAQRFGTGRQKQKNCLVLDRERYRYQQFISDIAGQDISAHGNDRTKLIGVVRGWLQAASGARMLPGGAAIRRRLDAFEAELPTLCRVLRLRVSELTFSDYSNVVSTWLKAQRTLSPRL